MLLYKTGAGSDALEGKASGFARYVSGGVLNFKMGQIRSVIMCNKYVINCWNLYWKRVKLNRSAILSYVLSHQCPRLGESLAYRNMSNSTNLMSLSKICKSNFCFVFVCFIVLILFTFQAACSIVVSFELARFFSMYSVFYYTVEIWWLW